jgi:hypothetical protein
MNNIIIDGAGIFKFIIHPSEEGTFWVFLGHVHIPPAIKRFQFLHITNLSLM